MALSRKVGRGRYPKTGGSSCMCGDHSAGKHHKHSSKKSKRSKRKKTKSKGLKRKRSKSKRSKRKSKGGFIRDRSVQMFVRSSGRLP